MLNTRRAKSTALETINLGIAFLLELCMLAALAYWGFQTSSNLFLRIVLGIGAPLLAAIIWGRFMAPQAKKRLAGLPYLLLKLLIFGLALLALAVAGQVTLAMIFVVILVINQILLIVWHQDPLPSS